MRAQRNGPRTRGVRLVDDQGVIGAQAGARWGRLELNRRKSAGAPKHRAGRRAQKQNCAVVCHCITTVANRLKVGEHGRGAGAQIVECDWAWPEGSAAVRYQRKPRVGAERDAAETDAGVGGAIMRDPALEIDEADAVAAA